MREACNPCFKCNSSEYITIEGPDHDDVLIRCGMCGAQTTVTSPIMEAIDEWNSLTHIESIEA